MQKRGQVAVFVVIGFVIVATVFLLFYFRDSLSKAIRESPTNTQEYLGIQLQDIRDEISRCVGKETNNAAKLLVENAGNFERKSGYMRYVGVNYPILCKEFTDNKGCLASPILISDLNNKLANYLPDKIQKCLNLEDFKSKDYELDLGDTNLNVKIFDEYIIVDINKVIKLTRGNFTTQLSSFSYKVDVPLGSLTNAANDLVQEKASGRDVDPVVYNLITRNKYRVVIKKPYPDEVYDLSLNTNNKYHFYFAFQGVGNHQRVEGRLK